MRSTKVGKWVVSLIFILMPGLSLNFISCYMKTEHKIDAHITIDIREVKAAANQIEDMVRSKKTKGDQSLIFPRAPLEVRPAGGTAAAAWGGLLLTAWKVDSAYAQMDLKYMTPAVEKAISDRGARLDRLEELMKKGCIGENNRGYVEYKSCPACESDSNLLKEVERIIQYENKDRLTIYQTIVEQNNLGGDKLSVVEKVFSELHRKNAPSGSFIQQDDGSWVKK